MVFDSEQVGSIAIVPGNSEAGETAVRMLVPQNALRILRRRTGGTVSRATFYRWIRSGKVESIRLGSRILIPWPALENLIRKCFECE